MPKSKTDCYQTIKLLHIDPSLLCLVYEGVEGMTMMMRADSSLLSGWLLLSNCDHSFVEIADGYMATPTSHSQQELYQPQSLAAWAVHKNRLI